MIRKNILSLLLLLATLPGHATTTVSGHVINLSTGSVTSGAFVRFWIRGCSGNQPRVSGTGIVEPSQGGVFYFDFPADSSGNVSGTLYSTRDAAGTGNGDIECGGSYTAVWYGMQVWNSGKAGPEVPVHAKSGATLDLSSVTPITTNPVVTSPTGDNTYLRLDAENSPVTGLTTFNAGIVAKKLNSIRFADQYASIQAAVTDAGTTGAVLIPPSYAGTDTYTNPNNIPTNDQRGGPFRRAAIERVGKLTLSATSGSMSAQTYYLNVTAVDAAGGEGMGVRNEQSIAGGASSGITATWPAVTGAASYNLYIGTASGAYLQMYNVTGLTKTITVTPIAGPTGLVLSAVVDATSTLKGDEFAASVTAFVNGSQTVRDDTLIKFIQLGNSDTNAKRIDASWNPVSGATGYRICFGSDRSGSRRVLLYCADTASTSYSLTTQETNLTFRPYWGNSDQVSSGAIYAPAAYFLSDTRITTGGQFMSQPIGEGDASYIADRADQSGQFAGMSVRTNSASKWQWGTRGVGNDKMILYSFEAGAFVLTVDGAAGATAPMFSFYRPGSDETVIGLNTDASGTARIKSQNNGSNYWELAFVHGTNKQFAIQSPTRTFLLVDDTANTMTYGGNSSTVHNFIGGISTAYQITSSVATGTAPYQTNSTTLNPNLNADMVGGVHASSLLKFIGTLTTTAAASDDFTVSGLTADGHCSAQATNATAAALTGVYLVAGSGKVSVNHSATANGTLDIFCAVQ